MIRRSTLRSLALRISLGVCAVALVAPVVTYSTSADAKRKKKSRKKAKRKAKQRAKKRAAAELKAEKDMHSKHNGAMERLDQIATATKNEELQKVLARIKTKEAEHKKLVSHD